MIAPSFLAGLALGGGLIIAIGAQNAFVIRQGIMRSHVFWLCLFCAVSDGLLIWAGVFGLGAVLRAMPSFITWMTWAGVAFLTYHGIKAMGRVMRPAGLAAAQRGSASLAGALLACAGFTYLNPHVYLDTVILVGSLANARPAVEIAPFAWGATTASFLWFFLIGYGAQWLSPVLGRPSVWRIIDALIALVMFGLALKLAIGLAGP